MFDGADDTTGVLGLMITGIAVNGTVAGNSPGSRNIQPLKVVAFN